jgi:AcrR family transcriptional regulator
MTVRRILDAAAEILEERGYEGVSTNRIAAAAEISPGSLYQYFPNKDAIR